MKEREEEKMKEREEEKTEGGEGRSLEGDERNLPAQVMRDMILGEGVMKTQL